MTRVASPLAACAAALLGLTTACRALVGIQDLQIADASSEGPLDDGAGDGSAPDASPFTFTASFDQDGQAVALGWDDTLIQSGTLTLDTTTSLSPPASARMTIDEGDASGYAKSVLTKGLPVIPSTIDYAFDVSIEPECTGAGPDGTSFARIYFGDYALNLFLKANGMAATVPLYLGEFYFDAGNANPIGSVSSSAVDASAWHHVEIVAHLADLANASADVTVGTTTNTYPLPLATQKLSDGSSAVPNLWLGLYSGGGQKSPCRVNYDNVSVIATR